MQRAPWWSVLPGAAAVALPFIALAPNAAAQTTTTLISNIGQADSQTAYFGTDIAQAFTTGNTPSTVREVEVRFNKLAAPFPVTVTIQTVSGNGSPSGTSVGSLTSPTFTTFTSAKTVSFTSSAGIKLRPKTTYFFVLDITSAHTNTHYVTAGGNGAEDAGGSAGWSIDNMISYTASPSGTTWVKSGDALKIRVKGVEHPLSKPTVSIRAGNPVTRGMLRSSP